MKHFIAKVKFHSLSQILEQSVFDSKELAINWLQQSHQLTIKEKNILRKMSMLNRFKRNKTRYFEIEECDCLNCLMHI